MKTLSEILEANREGGEPTYDELRYALRVMESLSTFRHMELHKAIEKPKFYTPEFINKEAFNREKAALSKSPKEWLGPKWDVCDPDVQQRHQRTRRAVNKWIDSKPDDPT